jgi:hypothetical protein
VRLLAIATVLASIAASTQSAAAPFGDPIPPAFRGTYARSVAGCSDKKELASLKVTEDHLAYYEADEYLLLGIAFEGSIGISPSVPMFNGRFTVSQEANLLGEMNLSLVMEKPNVLVRYALKEDGEPDESHADRWVRCAAGKRQ